MVSVTVKFYGLWRDYLGADSLSLDADDVAQAVAQVEEDGYFYLEDRIKDMVNVSGLKVYTIVVDEVLFKHPAVAIA